MAKVSKARALRATLYASLNAFVRKVFSVWRLAKRSCGAGISRRSPISRNGCAAARSGADHQYAAAVAEVDIRVGRVSGLRPGTRPYAAHYLRFLFRRSGQETRQRLPRCR